MMRDTGSVVSTWHVLSTEVPSRVKDRAVSQMSKESVALHHLHI